jgi:hypothetical protein
MLEEEEAVAELVDNAVAAGLKHSVPTMRKRVYDKEKKKACDRKYRAKNREKLQHKSRDKYNTEAGKACKRQYYQLNKHKYTHGAYKKVALEYYLRRRDVLWELREGKICEHCEHDQAHHLEFDHLEPSKKIRQVTNIGNIEKLRAEAAKCQLLCIWCHRVKTWKEQRLVLVIYTKPEPDAEGRICNGLLCQGQIRATEHFYHHKGKPRCCCKTCKSFRCQQIRIKLAAYVRYLKRNVVKQCQNQKCERKVEEGFEMCFDFDHIDPKTKKNSISRLVSTGASQKALDAELAKCRLLCCYCHVDHTAEQQEYHYSNAKKTRMKDTSE